MPLHNTLNWGAFRPPGAAGPAAAAAYGAAFRASRSLPVEGPGRIYFAAVKRLGEVVRDRSLCKPAPPILQQHFQRRRELPEHLTAGPAGGTASDGPARDRDRREAPPSLP